VVEGMITDSPGPYTVTLSKALALDSKSSIPMPVQNAKVTLFDDEGNSEIFTETTAGTYTSNNIIQGQVGHTYYIRVETSDGKIFESTPDKINPVGEIEEIRFEFEARTSIKPYGEIVADVFNIYVDSDAGAEEDAYVRWRLPEHLKSSPIQNYILFGLRRTHPIKPRSHAVVTYWLEGLTVEN
jgi:hypothetical protein